MAKAKVRVLGIKGIEKAFKKKVAEAEKALEKTVHVAAKVIRDAAADNAAQRTGELSERIVRETTEKKAETVTVAVGPDDEVDWYGLMVEFGTGSHDVTPQNKQALKTDTDRFAASAKHPGTTAQPYLRPALDEKADEAVDEAGRTLKKELKL